jgi:hypothetical protein
MGPAEYQKETAEKIREAANQTELHKASKMIPEVK